MKKMKIMWCFTLIEMMVSLFAFSILVLMMLNLLSSSRSSINRISQDYKITIEKQTISEHLRADFEAFNNSTALEVKLTTESPVPVGSSTSITNLDFYSNIIPYGKETRVASRVTWSRDENDNLNRRLIYIFAGDTMQTTSSRIVAYGVRDFKVKVYSTVLNSGVNFVTTNTSYATTPIAIGVFYSIADPDNLLEDDGRAREKKDFFDIIYLK